MMSLKGYIHAELEEVGPLVAPVWQTHQAHEETIMAQRAKRAKDHNHYDDVFKALADPTRREILQLVCEDELTVTEISKRVAHLTPQPGVSRHLAILRAAGLVMAEPGTARRSFQLADKGKLVELAEVLLDFGSGRK
jgi:DNA-binding transcriptional ArsR family regulator